MTPTVPAPTAESIARDYLGSESSWEDAEVRAEFVAERASQADACEVPDDAATDWPADLAKALARRVQRALALRSIPLGYEAVVTETGAAGIRVGGLDREIRRLEGPFRTYDLG